MTAPTYDVVWWKSAKEFYMHDNYEDSKKALLAATLNKEHRLPLPEGEELLRLREKQIRTPLSALSVFAKPQTPASPQPKPVSNQSTAENQKPESPKGPGK